MSETAPTLDEARARLAAAHRQIADLEYRERAYTDGSMAAAQAELRAAQAAFARATEGARG